MDMFFCLFCLIIFVSIKANNPKQKSVRMFVRLFLIATVLFFGETLAYIFRGNLGLFNILVTRIANLMVFAMNIAMANTYVRFVSSVFVEKGAEVSGNSVKIALIFSLLWLICFIHGCIISMRQIIMTGIIPGMYIH